MPVTEPTPVLERLFRVTTHPNRTVRFIVRGKHVHDVHPDLTWLRNLALDEALRRLMRCGYIVEEVCANTPTHHA